LYEGTALTRIVFFEKACFCISSSCSDEVRFLRFSGVTPFDSPSTETSAPSGMVAINNCGSVPDVFSSVRTEALAPDPGKKILSIAVSTPGFILILLTKGWNFLSSGAIFISYSPCFMVSF